MGKKKRNRIADALAVAGFLCVVAISAAAQPPPPADCDDLPGEFCIVHEIDCIYVYRMNNCYAKCMNSGGECVQYDCLGEFQELPCVD